VPGFSRVSNELFCDGVPLSAVADAEGTPLYVYSAGVLRERYRAFDRAFGEYPHRLHYALKANSTLAIARLLRDAVAAGALGHPNIAPVLATVGVTVSDRRIVRQLVQLFDEATSESPSVVRAFRPAVA